MMDLSNKCFITENSLEDVKKAEWYIHKYIELEEGSANEDR